MKKVVLHVGMHKTGTSSIQKSLSVNPRLLNKYGFTYPKFVFNSKEITNHSILFYNLFGNYCNYHINRQTQLTDIEVENYREDLFTQLRSSLSKESKFIFSGEDLCSLSSSQLNDLKLFLREYSIDDIEIVIYVRDPVLFAISNLQENIKSGDTFDSALDKVWSLGGSFVRDTISKFVDLFGEGSVSVLSYDDEIDEFGSIINSFYLRGLSIDEKNHKDIRKNVSLCHEVVEFYSYLNNREPLYDSSRVLNVWRSVNDFRFFESIRGTKFNVKKALLDKFESQFEQDRSYLTERYMFSLKKDDADMQAEMWSDDTISLIDSYISRAPVFYRRQWIAFLRDRSIELEFDDLPLAMKLISVCYKYKPQGRLIKNKYQSYKLRLA